MSRTAHKQLPLNMGHQVGATFALYVVGQNREALTALQDAIATAGEDETSAAMILLWGERGTGKTHLLQAASVAACERGADAIYIDCGSFAELQPDIFDELEHSAVLALDAIDALAGKSEWEESLFALLRRHRDGNGLLIASATHGPRQLAFGLPDLQTRLVGWSTVYQLKMPGDAVRGEVLQRHARVRGLEMGDDVVRYVLQHYPRDMHAIVAMLDDFDRASLVQQRRITIPFLRSLRSGD